MVPTASGRRRVRASAGKSQETTISGLQGRRRCSGTSNKPFFTRETLCNAIYKFRANAIQFMYTLLLTPPSVRQYE